jgi:alpha-glucosidase
MHDPKLRDNPVAPRGARRTRPFDYQAHRRNQSHRDIPRFLERLQAVVNEREGRLTVGEIGGERALQEMRAYTRGRRRLDTAYSFTFLSDEPLTPKRLRQALAEWSPGASPGGWPSWAFSNHDAPRAVSRWWPDRPPQDVAPLALLLLLCLRGNVFLYQGEELGLPQAEVPFDRLQDPEAIANWPRTLGRDGARTPMPWTADAPNAGFSPVEPWLPVDPRHAPLAVDAQQASATSTLAFTRAALALRRARPELRLGALRALAAPPGVLAFRRTHAGSSLLCVFNLDGEAPARFPAPGWRVLLGTAGVAAGGAAPEHLAPLQGYVAEKA